uniref:Uncharacterized protein n=1 Tax=Ananas comosus var. bracteatus TaxID=296719 RepID=A0A6V7PGY6_ANACO|nr:unnamed protein product [Ananas comosus var. bracteatus]
MCRPWVELRFHVRDMMLLRYLYLGLWLACHYALSYMLAGVAPPKPRVPELVLWTTAYMPLCAFAHACGVAPPKPALPNSLATDARKCTSERRNGMPWGRLIPRVGMLSTTGPLGTARLELTLSHVLGTIPVELREDLSFEEQPVKILAREVKKLWNRDIPYVKFSAAGTGPCMRDRTPKDRSLAERPVPESKSCGQRALPIFTKPSRAGEARDRGKGVVSS